MNPAIRKTAALVGVAAAGVYVGNRITRSKNNTVLFGINGQLDQMNTASELGRRAAEGASPNVGEERKDS